eukprot:TRINITY_DN4031_c0_g1_i1.p1 TRINITY_DN4031_c0_g1~~TRINITY_DN4031_c0_g1_i1.p1  ORF type:complete len:227 (+),score=51.49 TRINITY_DN4031_c0_g1_i1:352-1032(+)
MAGEDSFIRAAGLDLGREPLAQPSVKKTTRVRKDFRPGEGTRKRLEKSADDVITQFKNACRGDPKLEAPLLRHLLGDHRMEAAKKECGINIPTRRVEPPKLTKKRLQRMEREHLSPAERIAQDAQTVQEKHHSGSLDTLPTAVIRNFLLSQGQKTSGTKEKIIERVRHILDAQGQGPAPMEAMLTTEPALGTNGDSHGSEDVAIAMNGTYALPVSRAQPFVTTQQL